MENQKCYGWLSLQEQTNVKAENKNSYLDATHFSQMDGKNERTRPQYTIVPERYQHSNGRKKDIVKASYANYVGPEKYNASAKLM